MPHGESESKSWLLLELMLILSPDLPLVGIWIFSEISTLIKLLRLGNMHADTCYYVMYFSTVIKLRTNLGLAGCRLVHVNKLFHLISVHPYIIILWMTMGSKTDFNEGNGYFDKFDCMQG